MQGSVLLAAGQAVTCLDGLVTTASSVIRSQCALLERFHCTTPDSAFPCFGSLLNLQCCCCWNLKHNAASQVARVVTVHGDVHLKACTAQRPHMVLLGDQPCTATTAEHLAGCAALCGLQSCAPHHVPCC